MCFQSDPLNKTVYTTNIDSLFKLRCGIVPPNTMTEPGNMIKRGRRGGSGANDEKEQS